MSRKLYSNFLHSNLIKAFQVFFILFASTVFVQNSQAAPELVAESYAVVADDGDGAIEPNECVDITITLRNDGDAATNVSGTLTSNTAGVTVPVANATQSYPDIPAGSTGANSFPFGVSVSTVFACGLSANLTLVVTTDQGTFPVSVTLSTGSVPPLSQTHNENTNKNIKDGHGQVKRSHSFSGITTIVKVTASVHITHSKDSDLSISLIGPDGTTVDLSSNNGGTFPTVPVIPETGMLNSAPFESPSGITEGPVAVTDWLSPTGTWNCMLNGPPKADEPDNTKSIIVPHATDGDASNT